MQNDKCSPNVAGERAFPEAADGRPLFPMAAELYMCGADAETANFVARMLAQNGYRLIGPDEPLSTPQPQTVDDTRAALAEAIEALKPFAAAVHDWEGGWIGIYEEHVSRAAQVVAKHGGGR